MIVAPDEKIIFKPKLKNTDTPDQKRHVVNVMLHNYYFQHVRIATNLTVYFIDSSI